MRDPVHPQCARRFVLASYRWITWVSARSCRTAGIQRWGRGYEAVDGHGGRRVGLYPRQQRKRPHLKRELLSALKKSIVDGARAGRIQDHSPCITCLKAGQHKRDRFMMAVEQQDEVIIDDRPAPIIVFVGGAAREVEAEPSPVGLLPFLAGHLAPVGREPHDIFHAGTPDARILEEAAPAETGMGFSEL